MRYTPRFLEAIPPTSEGLARPTSTISVGLTFNAVLKNRTMKRTRTNPDFLNGVPELLILKLLARRPMYGYELVRAIEQASSQTFEFGEGCIYPTLHRLEAEGLLASRRETVAGRSRVVYRVTPAGKQRLSQSTATWQRIAAAISQVLLGDQDGHPAVA